MKEEKKKSKKYLKIEKAIEKNIKEIKTVKSN